MEEREVKGEKKEEEKKDLILMQYCRVASRKT